MTLVSQLDEALAFLVVVKASTLELEAARHCTKRIEKGE